MSTSRTPYWDFKLVGQLGQARTWQELCQVAQVILKRMSQGAAIWVGGALATEDLLTRDENHHLLGLGISRLMREGWNVFNRMPFEDKSFEVAQHWKRQNPHGLDKRREEEFDRPLLNSKWFSKAYFLPGWGNDLQARRERELLTQQGVAVHDFPQGIYGEILAEVRARSAKIKARR